MWSSRSVQISDADSSRSQDVPFDEAISAGSSGNFEQRKPITRIGWKEWMFIIVAILNITATIGLTIFRLIKLAREDNTSSPDFTFAVLILVNAIFCAVYVLNGILREDSNQLCVFMAAVTVILLYCTIEYGVRAEKRTKIKLGRLIAAWVMAPLNLILAVLVIRDFGWLAFKRGASEALQRVYKETRRFISLLILDFQVAGSLVVLVLRNGSDIPASEISILVVGVLLSVLLLILGYITVQKNEKECRSVQERSWACKGMIIAFVFVAIFEPAYAIYKLTKIFTHIAAGDHMNVNDYLLYTQIVTCFLALLVRSLVYLEFYRLVRLPVEGKHSEPTERTGLLAE